MEASASGKDVGQLEKFVPKEKMSKKAKKKMAAERRGTWAFSPITKKIDSKKIYNRKKISQTRYDDGREIFNVGIRMPALPLPAGYPD